MQYRTPGRTGMRVHGAVFRPVHASEALSTVRTALDLRINFIGVPPFCGNTKAAGRRTIRADSW